MKLIIAIVNSDDSGMVQTNLTKNGFSATKLATTGSFMKTGNTTFIIGAEDEKVDEIINIIKRFSKSRNQVIPANSNVYSAYPVEVAVGGATIFVTDVERFEKA